MNAHLERRTFAIISHPHSRAGITRGQGAMRCGCPPNVDGRLRQRRVPAGDCGNAERTEGGHEPGEYPVVVLEPRIRDRDDADCDTQQRPADGRRREHHWRHGRSGPCERSGDEQSQERAAGATDGDGDKYFPRNSHGALRSGYGRTHVTAREIVPNVSPVDIKSVVYMLSCRGKRNARVSG
jgi:hypothetical protein